MIKKRFCHLHFIDLPKEKIIESFNDDIKNSKKVSVVTPNMDFLRNSYNDLETRIAYNNADYITIDGKIIYFLSKIGRAGIKNRFSGSDIADPVFQLSNQNSYRVFLFGGKTGVPEKAAKKIKEKYPNVIICGTYSPAFGFENDEKETKKINKMILEARPNFVFMCCGSPKTEKYYFRNKEFLPPAVYLCIGATIDFISGNIKRAPKWMRECGLEWFYRLMKDFKRLSSRYLKDFCFMIKLIIIMPFSKKKFIKKLEESIIEQEVNYDSQ